MRVDEVRIAGLERARLFAETAPGWIQAGETPEGQQFRRGRPYTLPAPVAWVTPGTKVAPGKNTPSIITLDVSNPAPVPTMVVIARAWYPGWTAAIAGRSLSVHSFAGLLTAVDLPPQISGRIEIRYWPEGLNPGILGALVGLILLASAYRFGVRQGWSR
jgi:hypothetical protein